MPTCSANPRRRRCLLTARASTSCPTLFMSRSTWPAPLAAPRARRRPRRARHPRARRVAPRRRPAPLPARPRPPPRRRRRRQRLRSPKSETPVPFPRRLLNENEAVVLDLRPHWWVLAGSGVLLAMSLALAIVVSVAVPGVAHDPLLIAALVLVLVALARFVRRYARWATTNMVLTSDRLILRAGVFAKTGREIP